MAEYIEREAVLDLCNTEYQNRLQMFDYCGDTVAWNIGSEIKALPAADVAPVVHGRWIHYPDCGVTRCSHCGWSIEEYWESKHCPECGARIDGDEQ